MKFRIGDPVKDQGLPDARGIAWVPFPERADILPAENEIREHHPVSHDPRKDKQ